MAIDPSRLPWPITAKPTVRLAGLFSLDARSFKPIFRSPFHAIHLHEYSGTIRLAGREHKLEPGTLTISPADQDSSYDLPRPGVHWCIHFNTVPAPRGQKTIDLPLFRALGPQQGEAVHRFAHLARLHAMASSANADATMLGDVAAVALQELLLWAGLFDRDTGSAGRPRDGMIDRLYQHIDRHLHRSLRADELAVHVGLSQNHLARRFRERTGMTLPRYVLTRRMAVAKLLLETTDLPVKQIGLRVGLPDPHHFNKQFRAVTGKSPSAFRGPRRDRSSS